MSVTYDFHFFDRFKAFAAICVFTTILRSWSCCLLLMRRLKPDYLFVLWLFCRDCRKQDLYRSIAIVSSTSIHDPCVPLRYLRKKKGGHVEKETCSLSNRNKMVVETNMMCGSGIGHPPPSPSERHAFFPSFWNCGAPLSQGDGTISSMQPTDDSSLTGSASASISPPRTVRSLMNGIISPFINCVQPPLHSTCGAPTMNWEPRGGVPHHHEPPFPLISPDGRLSSQQQQSIVQPHATDIVCGRGGSSSRHPGNIHLRELIAANKARYSSLTKKQKMMLARQIVDLIHGANPPGRFLARDTQTGYWCDIGLPRSLEKTSQALREKSSSSSSVTTRTSPVSDIMDSTDMDDQPESIVSAPSDVSDQQTQATQATQATMSTVAAGNKSNRGIHAPIITIPPHLKAVYAPRSTRFGTAAPEGYPQIPRLLSPSRLQKMSPYPGSFHHRANMFLPFRGSSQSQSQAQAPQDDHRCANSDFDPPASLHLPQRSWSPDAFEVSWASESSKPTAIYVVDAPPPPPPPQLLGFTRSSISSGSDIHTGGNNGPASIMREKSDISPARQQENKRQRTSNSPRSAAYDTTNNSNINDINNKNNNESSQLEYAIESQLSLEERVIRPLTSPAALQQGLSRARSRPSTLSKASSASSMPKEQATRTDLDGLAALSTAAFLRLDESH
jgi:hypothetical protein